MKNLKLLVVFTLLMAATSIGTAESSISWVDVEKYRDIKSSTQPQKKFEQRVFKQFEKYLNKLTQDLPDGQKLWLKVKDLDLAGEILPGYSYGINDSKDLRVVKRIYYPQIKFSYHLSDTNGKVLKSGSVELKDVGFQNQLQTRSLSRDPLGYEKRMIKEWFNSEFAQQVAMK